MPALKGLVARPIVYFIGLYDGFKEPEKPDPKDRVTANFVPEVAFGRSDGLKKYTPAVAEGFQVYLGAKMPRVDIQKWHLKKGELYKIEAAVDTWSIQSNSGLSVEVRNIFPVKNSQDLSREIDEELEQFNYAPT